MKKETLDKFRSSGGNMALLANYAGQMRDENIILKIRIAKLLKQIEDSKQIKLDLK